MSNLIKNLLIALAITIVLIFGYFAFFQDSGSDIDANLRQSEASLEIERILSDTQEVNSYDIEGNSRVLTDQRFTSLVDRRIDIPEVGIGRENPFAPVQ